MQHWLYKLTDLTAIEGEGAATVVKLQILAVAGHRDIGQMSIEREGGEHLYPIDGGATGAAAGSGSEA
ncbi:hypothetical protein GCM10010869_21360 [Mesorhizobium tianshanense]|uniref:Uncharacterized protein n=1 Tax=Mesorhizobium tianshanense TaxID=39844 RepID=A0A562MQT9_9HYPH|nr:hypothetical protein [Mesorhizobium tianshanense]TWI22284.1 hypothetical protein IQ26_06717 [Mesorhizobium tianshanense]GLS36547.1 hypothetical protein GCM10010869_21360 [Mesorhizobium tianshanense]